MKEKISLEETRDISINSNKKFLEDCWDGKEELVLVYMKENCEPVDSIQRVDSDLDFKNYEPKQIYNWHHEDVDYVTGILKEISHGMVKLQRPSPYCIVYIPLVNIRYIDVEDDPDCWVLS